MDLSKLNNFQNFFQQKLGTNLPQTSEPRLHTQSQQRIDLLHIVDQADQATRTLGNWNYSPSKDTHKHHNSKIETKWDTFTPYAFIKLPEDNKVEKFLQLFEEFNAVKIKNNAEREKNRKLMHDITVLEEDLRKAKEKAHLTPAQKIRTHELQDKEKKDMKVQIKRLHQKIIALSNNNKNIRPQSSKPYGKGLHHTQKMIVPVNENVKRQLQVQRIQKRELLVIIEELKRNKFIVEEQLKNKQMNESSVPRTRKTGQKMLLGNQSQFQEYANDLQRWKEKCEDLQLCYNRMNQDKDKKIRDLSSELIDIQENQKMKRRSQKTGGVNTNQLLSLQQKNRELVEEKQKYQTEIRRLVQMPFYQNNKESLQLQQKLSDLQSKCKTLGSELAKTKDISMKYYSELEYKTKQAQLLKSENNKVKNQFKELFDRDNKKKNQSQGPSADYNDFYRKLLHLVHLEGDDPVWRKFANVAQPSLSAMNQEQLRRVAQNLWTDKLQLLAHLERAKIQLGSSKDHHDARVSSLTRDRQNLEEQLRITRARLDEWMSMERVNMRRDFQVHQQGGVQYDDTVSVFEAEQDQLKALQANENYFDLYFGQIIIDENSLARNPQNKIKNIAQVVSFLTLDFYNHETQHSDFVQGISKKLANNYSFKVDVNPYFVKYMSRNSIAVQLWSPQGTATVLLGRGEIWLKDLIGKASKDISPVVRGKCPIYHQDRTLIATVEYRIRMRLSISPFLEWAQTKADFDVGDPFSTGRKKTLSVTIERGLNFKPNINAFVYFTLQSEDYFTQPQRGPSPLWDFHREIHLVMNQQLLTQFKQNYLKFTIFDDQKDANEDVYGLAKANLTPLIDSAQNLDLKLDVRGDDGEEIGKLIVKVAWL